MRMRIETVSFPLKAPFVITGHTFHTTDTVRVILEDDTAQGRGEAVGVYYMDDTAEHIHQQLRDVQPEIDSSLTFQAIQDLLPAGGARNALDCAFWDYRSKKAGKSIWNLLNIEPQPLKTVCTVGIGSAEEMADAARNYSRYPNLKIKLDGDKPIEKLEAIRKARPDASLVIDVNQGWSFEELVDYVPACAKLGIAMIEQPLARGADEALEGFKSEVPLGADESCLDVSEYAQAARRYDVINIKLDKCGGLSAALDIVKAAQRDGKSLMVGNMTGSSLSMAPAFVIGQFCRFVDIDGPILLADDVDDGLHYGDGGVVGVPRSGLWG